MNTIYTSGKICSVFSNESDTTSKQYHNVLNIFKLRCIVKGLAGRCFTNAKRDFSWCCISSKHLLVLTYHGLGLDPVRIALTWSWS